MRRLWPPITVIEREILSLVASADVPSGSRTLVRRGGQVGDVGAEVEPPPEPSSDKSGIPEMPEALRERIAQRVRSRSTKYSHPPVAGQILRYDEIGRRASGVEREGFRPLMVLLNGRSDRNVIWHGWLVSSETDYAGPWDYVLQEDLDGIFDPVAGMVQVWNPVYVHLPTRPIVLAELPASRLAVVRALAEESARGVVADEAPTQAGRIWPRRVSGMQVFTGTPLRSRDDPRWRFQELYLRASEVLLPKIDEASEVSGALFDRVIAGFRRWASVAGISWTPVALVQQPMGIPSGEPVSYQLGDMARIMLLPDPNGRSLQLRVILTRSHGFHATLLRRDEVIQKCEITLEVREADFYLEADEPHTLLISDSKRNIQHRIPLS